MPTYCIEAYDRRFYQGIIRSWFKAQSKTVDPLIAMATLARYIDDHIYRSVAIWKDDDVMCVVFLDDKKGHQIWIDGWFKPLLMEHEPPPAHFQEITSLPQLWPAGSLY